MSILVGTYQCLLTNNSPIHHFELRTTLSPLYLYSSQSYQGAVINNKKTANAARPVLLSLAPHAPPTEEVASAACPELLDVDLMLLIGTRLADDVMVAGTTVVDVTILSDEGDAEVPAEVGSVVVVDATPGQSSLPIIGGDVHTHALVQEWIWTC
jgi:hypothetical protein